MPCMPDLRQPACRRATGTASQDAELSPRRRGFVEQVIPSLCTAARCCHDREGCCRTQRRGRRSLMSAAGTLPFCLQALRLAHSHPLCCPLTITGVGPSGGRGGCVFAPSPRRFRPVRPPRASGSEPRAIHRGTGVRGGRHGEQQPMVRMGGAGDGRATWRAPALQLQGSAGLCCLPLINFRLCWALRSPCQAGLPLLPLQAVQP